MGSEGSAPDRRRLRRLYAALALVVVGALGVLVGWSDRPSVRYAQMPCQYRATYAIDGPAAAVVLGSSRSQYGVATAALASGLGLDPATAPIVNVARGGRGPGQLYQQLVDLERARGIAGPILFEVSPQDTAFWRRRPLYYQYLPSFARAVPLEAVVDDWSTKPREPTYIRVRDLAAQLMQRVDTALETVATGGWRRNAGLRRGPSAPIDCRIRLDDERRRGELNQLRRAEANLRREVGRDGSWRDREPWADEFGRVNQDRQLAYLALAARFARERGLPIVFYTVPGYLQPPIAEAARRSFAERVGEPLAVPPDELLEQLAERDRWRDAYHLNGSGARLFTGWLADEARRVDVGSDRVDAAGSGGS